MCELDEGIWNHSRWSIKTRCNVSNARQLFTDGRARRKGRAYVSWNWRDYARGADVVFFSTNVAVLCVEYAQHERESETTVVGQNAG